MSGHPFCLQASAFIMSPWFSIRTVSRFLHSSCLQDLESERRLGSGICPIFIQQHVTSLQNPANVLSLDCCNSSVSSVQHPFCFQQPPSILSTEYSIRLYPASSRSQLNTPILPSESNAHSISRIQHQPVFWALNWFGLLCAVSALFPAFFIHPVSVRSRLCSIHPVPIVQHPFV